MGRFWSRTGLVLFLCIGLSACEDTAETDPTLDVSTDTGGVGARDTPAETDGDAADAGADPDLADDASADPVVDPDVAAEPDSEPDTVDAAPDVADADSSDPGHAPVLSSLMAIDAAGTSQHVLYFTGSDPDGDVSAADPVLLVVRLPASTVVPDVAAAALDVAGDGSWTGIAHLSFGSADAADAVTSYSVRIVDELGLESNTLETDVEGIGVAGDPCLPPLVPYGWGCAEGLVCDHTEPGLGTCEAASEPPVLVGVTVAAYGPDQAFEACSAEFPHGAVLSLEGTSASTVWLYMAEVYFGAFFQAFDDLTSGSAPSFDLEATICFSDGYDFDHGPVEIVVADEALGVSETVFFRHDVVRVANGAPCGGFDEIDGRPVGCEAGYVCVEGTCQPSPAGDVCATAVELTDGTTLSDQAVAGFAWNYDGTACTGYGMAGRDRVYEISVPAGEVLTVTVEPDGLLDPVILLYDSACDAGAAACLAGQDATFEGEAETLVWTNGGDSALEARIVVGSWAFEPAGTFSVEARLGE